LNVNEFRYIFEESISMLGRRKASTFVSTVIMGLSLLILLVFIVVTLNISSFIDRAAEELRVYVYLADGTPEAERAAIQYKLLGMKWVEEVVFVSREEALEKFKKTLGADSDVLAELEENPLPDAFRVKLKPRYVKGSVISKVASQIKSWKWVEDVRYGRKWLERGEKLVRGFYLADLFIGLIIFCSVVFVMSNTVRLTVYSREKTIDVMKLVGATNTYIRTPFVIEGALQSAFASILAIALVYALFTAAGHYVKGIVFLNGSALFGFVLFCAALGAVGSYAAMRRFLKV